MPDNPTPLFHLAAVLKHVLHAHDQDSIEYVMAARALIEEGKGLVDKVTFNMAFMLLSAAEPVMLDLWMLRAIPNEQPKAARLAYLEHGVKIATLSGKVSVHELMLLEALAHRLRISESDLKDVIDRYEDDEAEDDPSRFKLPDRDVMARTAARAKVLLGVASVLRKILEAHTPDSRERIHAAGMLSELADEQISLTTALRLLDDATDEDFPDHDLLEDMSLESRLYPLNIAVDVALVDGTITESERALLEQLAGRLLVPLSALEQILRTRNAEASRGGVVGTASAEEIQAACQVLGIPIGSDIAIIRAAHRRLIRENHPDVYPEPERPIATRRSSAINAAYDLLIGAR